jgi:DNA-binding transcriptional MerR regulator
MKTGEIAKMMGLSPKTITNWTDQEELRMFFGDGAKIDETSGKQRDYSSEDVLVINTVRVHKTRRNTWKDVAALLAAGHRETELPASAALTKTISPADQITTMMALKAERDTALAQLEDARFEIDRLRNELKAQREGTMKDIIQLNKEIARLELRLELLQQEVERTKSGTNSKPPSSSEGNPA